MDNKAVNFVSKIIGRVEILKTFPEMGILAAFGFKRRDILLSFLFEGLMIGSIAAFVG
ncbi:MAG: FtsX-like permease family protein, partial [Spirochaetota bacterium]